MPRDGHAVLVPGLVVARSDDGEGAVPGFSVVLRDVPRRETVAEDVRRMLTRDHLTGAANRRQFGQVLDREATHWRKLRQPVSLVALDLDHFKQVNDTCGHGVGEYVLKTVGALVKNNIRGGDLAARRRYGRAR